MSSTMQENQVESARTAEAGAPTSTRGGGRFLPRLGAVAAILGGAALIAAHGAYYGNWLMDDAAITFGYARSIADGHGAVLQPGAESVEGFSNPTWMVLLALGKLVGLFDRGAIFGIPDYVFFPKGLALLCCVAILALFYLAAKSLTSRPRLVTFLAGAVLACIPSFVIWIFSGLENSLYALVVVALAVVMVRAAQEDRLLTAKIAAGTGLLAALAALTRPDGLIFAGAYPILLLVLLRRDRIVPAIRSILLSCGVFFAVFGAYMVFRWLEYGRIIANTAVSKAQPIPTLADAGRLSELVTYLGWPVVFVAVGCLGVVLARSTSHRVGLTALLVTLGLAIAAFCVLQPDWMGEYRFATPIWALSAFVGALAVVEVLAMARPRGRVVLALASVVAVVVALPLLEKQAKAYHDAVKTPMCVVVERDARTVNAIADRLGIVNGSVGVIDLGGQSLVSRLELVDLAGLAHKEIADYLSESDVTGVRDYTFTVAKPDIITFIGSWDRTLGFDTDPRFDRDYHLVYHSRYPGGGIVYSYNHVGFWVRKERVADTATLEQLQSEVRNRIDPLLALNAAAPRRTCGDVLRPGQT